MNTFTSMINAAKSYEGQVNEAYITEERNEILALTADHPDLVDKFFEAVDSDPDWKKLAENGVEYYIQRIKYFKSHTARTHTLPSITPMIWGGHSGRVAVIKVTL